MPATLSLVSTACSLSALLGASQNISRFYPFLVLRAAEHILGSGISRFISTRFAGDRHSVAQVEQVPLGMACRFSQRFSFLGIGMDGLTLFTSAPVDCSLSLFGRMHAMPAFSLCLSSTPCFRCLSLGLRVVFPFANLCAFPSLVTVVSVLGPLLTVCGCGSVRAPAPLTSVSMDVCSRLHPPCRSVMWIPVLPPSIVAPMKWCTDFLVRRTLVWGLARWGHDPLFLKVALHDTWLCHPHAPSVMLHTVTCSIVSQSVPPSQISVNSGVVDRASGFRPILGAASMVVQPHF